MECKLTSLPESTWLLSPLKEEAKSISSELGIPLKIAQIMVNRSISSPEEAYKFLFGSLTDLGNPGLMEGMREAVHRIKEAVSRNEKILIFGDYDVDGILSVVILTQTLKSLGAEVEHFIPHRLNQGYGIKEKYIDIVQMKGASLVISVDCGIKAFSFVQKAKQYGIDVIITDHHFPGPHLPPALVILNPVIKGSGYPDKNLAGIGVVFKLIQALLGKENSSVLTYYLKFVSIGTIADVVELQGENRLLVKYGLKEMERNENKGLLSLMSICGLEGRNISVGDVGFRMGPRINAAGRMGVTEKAVQLFLTPFSEEAEELALSLNKLNSQRQKVERKIYQQVRKLIEEKGLNKRYKFLILGCEEWHRGVIGIVASRLKELYHRPVLLFSYQNGKALGSGRSIQEVPLIEYLEQHHSYFLSYGGHRLVGGCELSYQNMRPFKQALNAYVQTKITPHQLVPKIYVDANLEFKEIGNSLIENLALLSPFGMGNPTPVFLSRDVGVIEKPGKMKGGHCKFLVKQGGRILEAIGWNKEKWADLLSPGERIDLVYSLQVSEFLGEERINLAVKDIRKAT